MTDVMILAAGLGTRMKSRRAKVLHELAGKPLISHILRAAFELAPEAIFTVVGHQAAEVESAVRDEAARLLEAGDTVRPELRFVIQAEQRGTGHAVIVARDQLAGHSSSLLIVAGDAPLIKVETLKNLAETHHTQRNAATVLTVIMNDPTGYGRIIRDEEAGLLVSGGDRECILAAESVCPVLRVAAPQRSVLRAPEPEFSAKCA
jgi:bifunctional UDP-N-acetylglucosamine pyrophosphorylase/glucosamine-1-phosphate N-acetyltransferase